MTLDENSLLLAFAAMALTLLAMFWGLTFRATRSSFCAWWCIALGAFLSGAAVYLLEGTAQQFWALPCGNFLIVVGAAATWAGAKTLRTQQPAIWQILLAPTLSLFMAARGNPGANEWSGGSVFLLSVCVMFGLSAAELWRMEHTRTQVQAFLAVAAGFVSCYYFARWLVYLVAGSDGEMFTTYFGSATTTLLNLILLAVVSYSMAELSHEQSTNELRTRATRDGLTGLFNRTEFLRLAALATQSPRRPPHGAMLILADLDHFKGINDSLGHAAGDRVLQGFAAACIASVRSTDLVGRYGGEEFILLLPGMTLDRAEQMADEISGRLRDMPQIDGVRPPTVSYGLGSTSIGVPLHETIAAVDAALYRAKQLGRNRVVRVGDAAAEPNHLDEPRGKVR